MSKCVHLDVRPLHQRGEEPFPAIMAAVADLGPGDSLVLINSFEPRPLYTVLGRRGFSHSARNLGPDHWEITFVAPPASSSGASSGT